MTARTTSAALTGLVLATLLTTVSHAATAPGAATAPTAPRRFEVRGANTLPSLTDVTRGATPLNAIVSKSDTFLVASHGFDDLAGACQDRGWTGEDRTSQVYAHIVGDKTVNVHYFMGRYPATGIDNFTGSLATTRLYGSEALAVTDSGTVVFADQGPDARLFEAYPGTGIIRVHTVKPDASLPFYNLAYDPATGRVLYCDDSPGIRASQGNGEPVVLLGGAGSVPDDTTLAEALTKPRSLAVDAAGNIYFTETTTNRVRKVRTDGRVVTLCGVPGGANGVVTFDRAGNMLYVYDIYWPRIFTVDPVTGATSVFYGDSGPNLPNLNAIAFSGGHVYGTYGAGGVVRVASDGFTTVAGGGSLFGPPENSSNPTSQMLRLPSGAQADGAGGVYFMDSELRLVFRLDAGGVLSTLAGVPTSLEMGNRSLWFGADMTSHPEEVANWVKPSGYGNGWSQRLTSPAFAGAPHHNAVLGLDGYLHLKTDTGLYYATSTNQFFQAQILDAYGYWRPLLARVIVPPGEARLDAMIGWGRFKVEAWLGADGNESITLDSNARVRVILQTETSGSGEDGLGPDAPDGALVVDNLTLRDGDLDVLPPTDFEDGTTGPWTLSAVNGGYVASGMVPFWYRDFAVAATDVALQKSFDFTDPGCVWTFLAAGDTVNRRGLYARLASPWFAMAPGDTQLLVAFSGKLGTLNSGRVLDCWVRGKHAGDTRPRFASPAWFSYTSGTWGDDVASPYINQRILRYPADFQLPQAADSVQIVFYARDDSDILDPFTFPPGVTALTASKLPYLDDIRLYQLGVDRDHDGVADALDACPDSCAAGQDADGDGCVDATATMRHVESWDRSALPLRYEISTHGDPRISDGSDLAAITNGFAAWAAVPGTALQVAMGEFVTQTNASAYDGVNLVTFEDDYAFPPNVIGITPTLSALRRAAYDDRIVLPGQIVDADLILNPQVPFRTPTYNPGAGAIDLQSVVTHEAGHLYGLTHSGVLNSTMFFVLQPGQGAASLEADDRAAVAAAYPGPTFATDFATVAGQVVRGGTGYAIPGALVTAVQLDGGSEPADSVASDYTDEGGNYALRGLAPGSYSVRITPLDGELGGYALTPAYISARLKAVAQTNFPAEWWCEPESDRDTPDQRGVLTLAAGELRSGLNVVTNVDTIPPTVVAVSPGSDTTDIRIDTSILVNFSERIDETTLQGNFRLHIVDSTHALGGGGTLVNGGRNLVFTPTNALLFETEYQLDITTGLADRNGVHLAPPFTTRFTTQDAPPVAITDVRPRSASPGSYITILGTGFDPAQPDSVQFIVDPPYAYIRVPAASVTPTAVLVRVPVTAMTGELRVVILDQLSNPFTFTVLPALAQTAPSYVTDVDLGFAPTDVALGPAGDAAYAVGSGGLAVIDLQTLDVLDYGSVGGAQSLALTPDGKRAVITRPATGDVVTVDVAHGSGTFGQVLGTTTLPSGATPQGVAIAPTGGTAFVTDPGTRLVYKIDIDPLSATCYGVLDEVADTTVALTGGIATSPDGNMLYYGTSDAGVRAVRLPGHTPTFVDEAPSTGGVAVDPAAHEVLFARAGATGANLFALTVLSDTTFTPQVITLGGDIRDVAYNKDGNAAYVVNSATSQLQMLSVDPDNANYREKIAEVATGSTPVAIAVSGFGDVIAVANYGSRSLSLYRIGGGAALLRAVPEVARPGDVVALIGSGVPFGAGSQVDVGSGLFAPERQAAGGNGAAFVVPAGPQRDALVAAVDSLGMRTLGLPLRIVDPVTTMTAKSTGFAVRMDSAFCGLAGYIWGQMEAMRLSPDGKYLAVARDLVPGECGIWLEMLQVTDEGPARLGAPAMSGLFVAPSGSDIHGMDFTTDGKQLWVSHTEGLVNVVDTDPASLMFGTVINWFSMPQTATPSTISADPLGRCMVVGDRSRDSLAIFDVMGMFLAKVQTPGPTWAAAITPDGHYVVTAGGWRTGIVDLEAHALFSSSPTHGSSTTPDYQVAIPTDGKRAVVTYPYGVGIYNLDPAAGPVGQELYYGTPLSSSYLVTSLAPAPDGHGVLAASSDHDSLVHIDPRTTPPTLTWIATAAPVRRFAASADGRRLWIGTHTVGYPGPGAAGVGLYSLSSATSLALVSGGGQSGLKSAFLSQPLIFRATDGIGNPQVGAVLRFDGVGGALPILDDWDTPLWHVTDAKGEVSVEWMLSSAPGTDSLVVSLLGVPGVSVLATAQVVVADSLLPPVVVSLGPADGSSNLNAGTAVSATFNKGVDSASVVAKMVLHVGANTIAGSYKASADRKTFFFQPAQPLTFSARCSLVVESGIQDQYGLTTAQGVTSVFTIMGPPALAISSLSPPAATTFSPVVIGGQGFSPIAAQNTVLFNGVLATVTSATAAAIVANVPLAATTGSVTVQTGSTTSNALTFVVLEPNASPGGVINNLSASQGIRDVAITSDGSRAYVTNPVSNSVTALDIPGAQTITSITVGLQPQGVALLPDDSRAYVANTGSNDVSVIDIRPASADYHKVVATITVGSAPLDIAVSALGPRVIVVNSGSKDVSLIDANPGNATFDQVTATANTGSAGQAVVIAPDGGRAFVATSGGTVVVIDILTGAVTATANTGSAGVAVGITPDGAILLVLCQDGTIRIVDVSPGSPTQYQVTATANVGSSGVAVIVTPDGALAYVTSADGNSVLVFSITSSGIASASTISPGPAVVLTLIATIPVGQGPAGIAIDPSHGAFALVCNAAAGTVSVIGFPTSLPPVTVDFDFAPNTLNLKSMGKWVTGHLEPKPPRTASEIVLGSIRLNGIVPADTAGPPAIGDEDCDGVPDLMVKFSRQAVSLTVPDGDRVPVTVTGTVGPRLFTGTDTIRVKRAKITAPVVHEVVPPGRRYTIRWEVPKDVRPEWVAVLHTFDRGETWVLDATHLPNTGAFEWDVPLAVADSARVAVVLVESADSTSDEVTGVLGQSDPFEVFGATEVEPAPAVLAFEPIRPNPALGEARMRFGLPRAAEVKLEVFDLQGRKVRTLATGLQTAGWHDASWNGRMDGGARSGAGLYFVRFRTEGREFRQRLIWLR